MNMDEKFEYFIDRTDKNFEFLWQELKEMKTEISDLKIFRAKLFGGAMLLSALVTIAIELLSR